MRVILLVDPGSINGPGKRSFQIFDGNSKTVNLSVVELVGET